MTKEDIQKLRDHCEVTKAQFKERITDKYDVGCEMVAFCNSHGGQLVIGINDKTGVMNPLLYQEVQETTHEFVIVFRRKSNQVSVQVSDQVGNQVTNGVANEVTNGVEHQVANQVVTQVANQVHTPKPSLTRAQKDIVNFCSVSRSAQEILERIGLTNQTFNRKKHIQPLVDMGVLEMTNPENPNASNQKYRKVRK